VRPGWPKQQSRKERTVGEMTQDHPRMVLESIALRPRVILVAGSGVGAGLGRVGLDLNSGALKF
jgi:hypothetical protein